MNIFLKESLKIRNGNRIRKQKKEKQDNGAQSTQGQTMIYKTLQRQTRLSNTNPTKNWV